MENVYTHQLNAYYCITYPADDSITVLGLLSGSAYSDLAEEAASMTLKGGIELFASLNSDVDEAAQYGFIAVECMVFEGPKCDNAEDISLKVEPRDMVKRETTYKAAVKCLTDIYTFIILECKKKNIDARKIEMGWHMLPCVWEDDDSSSSEPPAAPKNTRKQPARPTPAEDVPVKPTVSTPIATIEPPPAATTATKPTPKNKRGTKKQG